MSIVCGKISANISKSCTVPLQAGTKERLVLINKDDIASISYNNTNADIVEDIVMVTGAVAWSIAGKNNSIEPNAKMIDGAYDRMFDHTVKVKGFDISPDIKSQLNAGKDGKYVLIVENYFTGTAGNSAFEVYGLTTGLEITILERDPNSQDTQGAFDITFMTKTNKEPKLPNTFYVTSYSATKTIVDALLV